MLLIEARLLRETEGERDLNQDVSDPLLIRIGEGDWSEQPGENGALIGVGAAITDSFGVPSAHILPAQGRVDCAVRLLRRELNEERDSCDNDSTEDGRNGRESLSGDTSIDPRLLEFFGVK